MSRGKQFAAFLLLMGFAIIFISGTNSPQQNGAVPAFQQQTLGQGEWRLDRFENQAYELQGQLYDKGTFTNVITGEQVEARCLNPEAGDPNLGDLFTQSGNQLIPVAGGPQTFEVFEIITTQTPVSTSTPIPTAITIPTNAEPLVSQPESQDGPTLSVGQYLILGLCCLVLLVVGFFVGGAWLHQKGWS